MGPDRESGGVNDSFRPLRPERLFRPGQTVRWNPPAGAYSPASAQSRYAGMTGSVISSRDDGYAVVMIGNDGAMLCNTAYLETA